MSGTPKYKCFRGKEYIAATKYPEDAAVLISAGVVDRVSYDRALWVWTESDDSAVAANSYDDAAEIMGNRIATHHIKFLRKNGITNEQLLGDYGFTAEQIVAAE